MKPLSGLTLVSFESRHAKTMADLIRLQGGIVISAPSMKEVPLEENKQVFDFAENLFSGQVDILILLTGVGARALVSVLETRYPKEKIMEVFKKLTIVPRGPKPIRVLNEWGVPYALTVPEPNTWRELLEELDRNSGQIPLKNKKVTVQEYGVRNAELIAGLAERGAQVVALPVYRWALPDDVEPLKNAILKIVDAQVQVALFTTAVQIEHVFKIAAELGLEKELRERLSKMAVASVGPDCTQALVSCGVSVDIEPESPKMGPLVLETAKWAKETFSKKNKGLPF